MSSKFIILSKSTINDEYKVLSIEIASLYFLNYSLKLWTSRHQSLCIDQSPTGTNRKEGKEYSSLDL